MASATDGQSRVKDLKKILDNWNKIPKEMKDQPKAKQDIFLKTCSDFRELLRENLPETEKIKKGQTMIGDIKKEGKEKSLPSGFFEQLESTLTVPEKKKFQKKDGVERTGSKPGTPENGGEDNQCVNSGPAPAPIHSTHSPKQAHRTMLEVNKPGGNPDTEQLQKEIARLTKEFGEKCEELKKEKKLSKNRENELEELEAQIKTKDEKMKTLEQEAADLAIKLAKENLDLTQARKELDSKGKLNLTLEERVNECVSQELAYKKQFEEMTTYVKKLEKDKEKSRQRDMEHFKDELKQQARKHDDQYKKLMAERDDLRDRFSKLAGAKLQEKNADIADLSDPNRAMKLSEKFGQIYDDEWTNAFEVLTDKKAGLQLKDAINFLLRLLQECWSYCNSLMETQMESVHSMFLLPAQNVAKFDQKKMGKKNPPRISSKDNQTLYDLRRKIGVFPAVVEEVKEALLSESKRWDKQKIGYDTKYVDACAPYIQKCAEICWLMALHDPPLYMKMEVKPGEKLDQNIYSVYSSSGNSIDFLVWPPLYNGKEGGLLAKGVVEPQRTIGKKK